MYDNFVKVATNSEKWFVNLHEVISLILVRDAFFWCEIHIRLVNK